MKSSLLKVFLCIVIISVSGQTVVTQSPKPESVKAVNLEVKATRLEAIRAINSTISWWEDYRIEINHSFWGKLWLQIKRFFIYLTLDMQYLADVSKSKYSDDIFLANKWGMELSDLTAGQDITGWQLLELESQALSKALNYCGINRTLTDEAVNIRLELEKISKNLDTSYREIINAKLIEKPMREFKPDNAWVYYIFGIQHGLLPENPESSPQEMLNTQLTQKQVDSYVAKLKELLAQMAQDLN